MGLFCHPPVVMGASVAVLLVGMLAMPTAGQTYYMDATLSIISPGPASMLQQSAAYAQFSVNSSLVEVCV